MIARAAAVCAALSVAAGGVVVAQRLPGVAASGDAAADRPPTRLAIPAATATLACPGRETSIVPEGGMPVPAPGPFALTVAAAGADTRRVRLATLAGGTGGLGLFGRTDGLRVLARDGDPPAPLRLEAAPSGAHPTRLSAMQTTLARSGDLRGLLAGVCPSATTDAWLVGGGTAAGRRGRLLLANPTPAVAVVDVFVAGPSGAVDVPAGRGLVVAPGRVRAVQLDALAPGLNRLAVHVLARRGRIALLLHDSYLKGADPAGVDDVSVAAPAARSLVVPGIVVPARASAGSVAPVLRLVAPGADDAVVHLHLVGPAGDVLLAGGGVVTVPAGGVVDVPLPGLAPGGYAAFADADVPIVAGTQVSAAGPATGPTHTVRADFGWVAAAPALRGDVVAALPRPLDSRHGVITRPPGTVQVALTGGDESADVAVRQTGTDGGALRQNRVRVPAHRTVLVPIGPDAVALVLSVGNGQQVWGGISAQVDDPAGPLLTLLSMAPPASAAQDAPVAVADPWLTGAAQSSSVP
jgi:hypothetical protein